MHVHEVVGLFFVCCCFCFVWIVVSNRGCFFVFVFVGGFVWGVVGVGGGMRRLFFLKSCTRNLRYYKSPELGLNLSGS